MLLFFQLQETNDYAHIYFTLVLIKKKTKLDIKILKHIIIRSCKDVSSLHSKFDNYHMDDLTTMKSDSTVEQHVASTIY